MVSISFLCVSKVAILMSSVLWLLILGLVTHKMFGPVAGSVVILVYTFAGIYYCVQTKRKSVSSRNSKRKPKSGLTSERNGDNVKTKLIPASPIIELEDIQMGSAVSGTTLRSNASIHSSSSWSSSKSKDDGGTIARKTHHKAIVAWQSTNHVFVVLIVSTIFVCVWKYTVFRIIFAFTMFLLLWRFICPYFRPYVSLAWTKLSSIRTPTGSVIFPPPVAVIGQAVYKLDRLVLSLAIQWVGDIVTMCIVVGLLVTLFVASIMLLLQVQVELSHYLAESVVLWNRTMEANPDINQ